MLAALVLGMTVLASPGAVPARDQLRLDGLVRWGHELVALSTPPRVIDLAHASTRPVVVPTLDVLHSVAGDSVRYALGMRRGVLTLVRETHGGWEDVPLPPIFAAAPLLGRLGASGEELAVVELSRLSPRDPPITVFHFRHAGAWKRVTLQPIPAGPPKHVVFAGDRWLLGASRGEWGGGLQAVSLAGGVSTVPNANDLPVNGIVVTRSRRVFVGFGLSHLGLREARLVELSDAGARTLVEVGKKEGARGEWRLPVDSVEALALDAQDRLHVLTGRHGIVRLVEGKPLETLPGWPPGPLYPNGLLLEGELAVVSTLDSGIFLLSLTSGALRQVPLTP